MDAIFVRNNLGEMVPVNTMVSLEEVNGPEIVNRYNLFNSITINATPADGYSTGDAMNAIEEIAAELPTNYSYEWTGMSLEEKYRSTDGNYLYSKHCLCILSTSCSV